MLFLRQKPPAVAPAAHPSIFADGTKDTSSPAHCGSIPLALDHQECGGTL